MNSQIVAVKKIERRNSKIIISNFFGRYLKQIRTKMTIKVSEFTCVTETFDYNFFKSDVTQR